MKKLFIITFVLSLLFALSAGAADIDDGISSYLDDPIANYDTLGSVEPNVEYIILNAKSRSTLSPGEDVVAGEDSTGNINSVVVGTGSIVYGDIIVIDNSLGDKVLTIGSGSIPVTLP